MNLKSTRSVGQSGLVSLRMRFRRTTLSGAEKMPRKSKGAVGEED
jgi:hypothetical protein